MAGRHRVPRHLVNNEHDFYNGPLPPHLRHRLPLPHPAVLEEDLAIQNGEIRRLLAANKHLAEDNAAFQRELLVTKDDIHSLSQVIPKLKAEKAIYARDLIEKALKMEAELRATEPLRAEVLQLRTDAQMLSSLKQEMTAKIQDLTDDLSRLRADNQKIPIMRADIEGLHQELERVRSAFEYEKKANLEQIEHKQGMEKNLISMAHEIDNMRAELMGTEKRVVGHGTGGYGMYKGSHELGHSGGYSDIYGGEKGWSGTWGHEKRGPSRH